MRPVGSVHPQEVGVAIPEGFQALPLPDPQTAADSFTSRIAAAELGRFADDARSVCEVLAIVLARLPDTVIYCGLGRHVTVSGQLISACLTVSALALNGPRNPRLTLGDYFTSLDAAGLLNGQIVTVHSRQVALVDRVIRSPTPYFSFTSPEAEPVSPCYQIEAAVASPDGDALAVVQLSTADLTNGVEYLESVAGIAASARFGVRASEPNSALQLP